MRVIEKIIEIKGGKKFKLRNESVNQKAVQGVDYRSLKYEDAYKEFRKITNTTHYASAFG